MSSVSNSGALRFIRQHGTERIGVPDVVRHLDVSRSTVETRLKQYLGRTIRDEIQRLRLEAALVHRLATVATSDMSCQVLTAHRIAVSLPHPTSS